MSLTKLSATTFIPGTPAVDERPYSRYCPPASPTGGTVDSTHGAVVSTYAVPVTQQTCYSCPPTIQLEVCTTYADGYTSCVLEAPVAGGTGT